MPSGHTPAGMGEKGFGSLQNQEESSTNLAWTGGYRRKKCFQSVRKRGNRELFSCELIHEWLVIMIAQVHWELFVKISGICANVRSPFRVNSFALSLASITRQSCHLHMRIIHRLVFNQSQSTPRWTEGWTGSGRPCRRTLWSRECHVWASSSTKLSGDTNWCPGTRASRAERTAGAWAPGRSRGNSSRWWMPARSLMSSPTVPTE